MSDDVFKKCPMCEEVWKKREDFLKDTSLVLNGYQVDFTDLGKGFFFFTHNAAECFSTMAIEAEDFFDLNPGKPHKRRRTLLEDCPGYCLRKNILDHCEAECECAFVRDVIEIILKMQKGNKKLEKEVAGQSSRQ